MVTKDYPGSVSKVKVSLFIQDFKCKPDQITEFLKVNPTMTRERGLIYSPSKSAQRFSFWKLEQQDELDVEVGVRKLMRKVKLLKNLRKKFRGLKMGISCIVYFVGDDSRPTISLTSNTMEKLSECGCDFNVDYYIFGRK